MSILEVGLDCESLEEYLRVFDVTLPLMQDADSLTRVAFELAISLWFPPFAYSYRRHLRAAVSRQ